MVTSNFGVTLVETISSPNDDFGNTGLSLEEAADYIVPVSIQGADQIDRLRTAADGKFLSASVAGPYRKATQPTPEVGSNTRHIEL